MSAIDVKKMIALEREKCKRDPMFFFREHVYIQHPVKGRVKFKLYEFQEETLNHFVTHDYNIVLKSRQMGISTLIAAFALHTILFESDKNVLIVATKLDVAKNLIEKVRFALANLPSYLRVAEVSNAKTEISLSNGSKIKCVSSNPDATRSEALSLLVMDEAAFIRAAEEIWTSAYSTLSTGGRAIILSTPNGTGQWFHQKWVAAESGEKVDGSPEFNPIRLKWDRHPERNQKWRDVQTKQLGAEKAAQECDCSFITSGNTVIPGDKLEAYEQSGYLEDPKEMRGSGKELWIFRHPEEGHEYLLTSDVARGDGTDFSGFHVIDLATMVQVAEFKGKIGTRDYARVIMATGFEYNTALVSVENASMGWDVIQEIIDKKYPNIHYSQKEAGYIDPVNDIRNGKHLQDVNRQTPGFTISSRTRPLMISKLIESFTFGGMIYHSRRLHSELKVFIWWSGGKAAAQQKYNDDLVISWCQALYLIVTALRINALGSKMDSAILGGIQKSGAITPESMGIYRSNNASANPWRMETSNGNTEDITWLL